VIFPQRERQEGRGGPESFTLVSLFFSLLIDSTSDPGAYLNRPLRHVVDKTDQWFFTMMAARAERGEASPLVSFFPLCPLFFSLCNASFGRENLAFIQLTT
jgi:hypothetical protein